MNSNTSDAKRIAKNTAFMYGRMILLMVISLFTSRVILKTLGVTDYGIYNVVGSIVMMFNSLRTMFASSTQRYLNYEMGKGNNSKLKVIFNLSLQINAIVAVIFVVLVELVGVWFVGNKLNADPDRISAAHWVLQFSILSSVITIFTTTFDAEIIAHERMDFYAYMSIIDALLRLSIVYVVYKFTGDKLIIYGMLVWLCTLVTFACNVLFCRTKFLEVRLCKVRDKDYLKRMFSFAGWNFLGNTAFAVSQNGLNMVLNIFGGPVVNAARGIAMQLSSVLSQIISNIVVVIKPFFIQTYAKGEIERAYKTLNLSSKIFFSLQLYIVIFFTFFAEEVIRLWLGSVPQYVVPFLIIVLWHSLIRSLHGPIDTLFNAVGNLKYYQICEGVMLSLPVVASYFLLKLGSPFYTAFLSVCGFEIVNLMCILLIAKKQFGFPLRSYIRKVVMPCLVLAFPYIVTFGFGCHTLQLSTRLLIMFLLFGVVGTLVYGVGLNYQERIIIKSIIRNHKH